jgi:hypothetical protein
MYFNKIVLSIFFITVMLFPSGCGKKKIEAGSPEEVLSFIKEKGNSVAVFDFYTDDTVSLMKKYMKMSGMKDETSTEILSFIPENSEYNITDRKIEGKNCSMNLIFTRHKSENAVGLLIPVKMVKEGKSWKIDRKIDFQKLIESYEKKGAEVYLDRIK